MMKKILDIFKYFTDHQMEVRKPRIKTDFLQKIQFSFPDYVLISNCKINLKNISTSGLAFSFEGILPDWKVGSKIKVDFDIYNKKSSVEAQIVRIENQIIGARLVLGMSEFSSLISHFYKVEFAAAEMSHIESEKLQPVLGGHPHWFHGDHSSELYFVEKDGRILNFHITFFGNTLEFTKEGKFFIGHVWEELDHHQGPLSYKGSNFIKVVDNLEVSLVQEAKSFIWQIPLLSEEFKNQIIQIIDSNINSLVA